MRTIRRPFKCVENVVKKLLSECNQLQSTSTQTMMFSVIHRKIWNSNNLFGERKKWSACYNLMSAITKELKCMRRVSGLKCGSILYLSTLIWFVVIPNENYSLSRDSTWGLLNTIQRMSVFVPSSLVSLCDFVLRKPKMIAVSHADCVEQWAHENVIF